MLHTFETTRWCLIFVFKYICICVCVYMYMCMYMYICLSIRICVYVRMHMYVCIYVNSKIFTGIPICRLVLCKEVLLDLYKLFFLLSDTVNLFWWRKKGWGSSHSTSDVRSNEVCSCPEEDMGKKSTSRKTKFISPEP